MLIPRNTCLIGFIGLVRPDSCGRWSEDNEFYFWTFLTIHDCGTYGRVYADISMIEHCGREQSPSAHTLYFAGTGTIARSLFLRVFGEDM